MSKDNLIQLLESAIVLVLLALSIGGMFYIFGKAINHINYESIHCHRVTKRIVSIGGCDKFGLCGVKLEDGTFSSSRFPVIDKGIPIKVCE